MKLHINKCFAFQFSDCIRLLVVLAFIAQALPGQAQSGRDIYRNYCAGCHGAQLQGSTGTALIKNTWKHGGDKKSIINSIRQGIPGTEMAKWEGILSDKQIESVTNFILDAQRKPEVVKVAGKPLRVETKLYPLKIEKLVTKGLSTPWGIEFVDMHRALISERTGELRWMVDGKVNATPVANTPKTYAQELTGGYMDIALDPAYAKNGWVYLAFSHNTQHAADKNTPGMTKVVRGRIKANQWTEEQTLFEVPDSLKLSRGERWGCRFLFDKDGYLYFSIGDMGRGADSQILSKPSGKIYRIHSDGSIPTDNPLYGQAGLLQAIYSWGNRNVQGIAQHPVTGLIYVSEHGPRGGDELNIIRKGGNYGWPVITYGVNYDGSIVSNDTARIGMEQPITYWTPSIAVSAITFVTSPRFPRWKDNLIVTALAFEEIRRLVIDDDHVVEQEIMIKGYGRVRDVKFGPDGALYVLTNAPDAVLRVTPHR